MSTIGAPIGLVLGAHWSTLFPQLRSKRVRKSAQYKDHMFHESFERLAAATFLLLTMSRLVCHCGCRSWGHAWEGIIATRTSSVSAARTGSARSCASLLNWLLHFPGLLPFTTAAIFLFAFISFLAFILSRSLSVHRLFFFSLCSFLFLRAIFFTLFGKRQF